MAKETKERILAAALELFSQNGYAGTNIRELSAALGLVKSGVYKHFESKEAIWNALLDEMVAYYDGGDWLSDFTADEAGLLPEDLKRGVLSEDGLFDLLERARELDGKVPKEAPEA